MAEAYLDDEDIPALVENPNNMHVNHANNELGVPYMIISSTVNQENSDKLIQIKNIQFVNQSQSVGKKNIDIDKEINEEIKEIQPILINSEISKELYNLIETAIEKSNIKCVICLEKFKEEADGLAINYYMCIHCGVVVHSTCGSKTKTQCGHCRKKSTEGQTWYYIIKSGHHVHNMLQIIPKLSNRFNELTQVHDTPMCMFNQLELQYKNITDSLVETLNKTKDAPHAQYIVKMNLELTNNLMQQSFQLDEIDKTTKRKFDEVENLLASAKNVYESNLKKEQELTSEYEKLAKFRRYIGSFVNELDNTIPKEIDNVTSTKTASKQINEWQKRINQETTNQPVF